MNCCRDSCPGISLNTVVTPFKMLLSEMAIKQVRAEKAAATEEELELQLPLTREILADASSKFNSALHDVVNNDPDYECNLILENSQECSHCLQNAKKKFTKQYSQL